MIAAYGDAAERVIAAFPDAELTEVEPGLSHERAQRARASQAPQARRRKRAPAAPGDRSGVEFLFQDSDKGTCR